MRRPTRWTISTPGRPRSPSPPRNPWTPSPLACADFDGGCPLGNDPRGQIQKAVSALDEAPGAGPGQGTTNGGSVLLTLLLRLGDLDGWPELATALAAAAQGNGEPIQDMLTEALGGEDAEWLGSAIIYALQRQLHCESRRTR